MKRQMQLFFKALRYCSSLVVVSILSFIPKNKNIWVFGAWFGSRFADNPKYLYLYLMEHKELNIKPIWICKNKKLLEEMKKKGLEVYYYMSLHGMFYQLVASKAFFGHSIRSDLNSTFISFNTQRIQMWHGIPLKKIGFDDEYSCKWFYKKRWYKFFINEKYDYVLSTGGKADQYFETAFDMPANKIISTGYPRNDVFKKSKKDLGYFNVIYMPTFRGEIGQEISLFSDKYDFDFDYLEKTLLSNNIKLTLRVHPANKPSNNIMALVNQSKNISFSLTDDIYETINNYDCLITDYSSIMFDFALTQRPIIFAPFDLDKYLSLDRKMYFSYDDVTAGNIVKSWPELIDAVVRVGTMNRHINCKNDFLLSYHDQFHEQEDAFCSNVVSYLDEISSQSK
ncbi:CDP-glycerol glycerophosphotransferase family protein [Aeromonas caviae]|uniref:CDP-glycerol glycerophosphotransferase family protein n=1 Tax=Aeromonas caviae TaxID=648 RepID=UPI00403F8E54